MSPDPSSPKPPAFAPPVSAFVGPVGELIAHQMLTAPLHPGFLAALNQFEIQRVLGGGGMGVVLLARDAGAARNVAVKMVRPELVADQRIVHRFVREAGHLQKLKHPNIVPVLEVSNRSAGPYFVMPWFERGSLAGRIRPGVPLDPVFILDMASNIAAGLQFAHRRGIIHCDLKPANILITDDEHACLADFGLARAMFNDSMIDVDSRQCEGTAPYMSPGVAAGDAEDTRCDIYAFGALLYEMLTGEPPYAASTLKEIRRQILDGPPKPILERNPNADPRLVVVAEGAMARQLRDRYAEMTDVLLDLERINESKPPVGPRGLVRGGMRQVRRVPPLGWLAASVALVGIAIWLYPHSGSSSKPPIALPTPLPTNPPIIAVKMPPPPLPSNPPSSPPEKTNPQPIWTAAIFAGQPGTSGNVDGAATNARFSAPGGVAVDTAGNLYVADTGNNTIRKIIPTGDVTTLAGQAGFHGSLDGPGSTARFFAPFGIALDQLGNIYVTDLGNSVIRKITPAGQVSTLAGLAGNPGPNDGLGDNAQFRNPFGIAVDNAGAVYVADTSSSTIRKISSNGAVTTVAGLSGSHGNADGSGNMARFWDPHGIAVDNVGNVWVVDSGNNVIRKISPPNLVTTLFLRMPDNFALKNLQSIAVDKTGYRYVTDASGPFIRVISNDGTVTQLVTTGDLGHSDALAVDGAGNIYLADTVNNVIRKLARPNSGDQK